VLTVGFTFFSSLHVYQAKRLAEKNVDEILWDRTQNLNPINLYTHALYVAAKSRPSAVCSELSNSCGDSGRNSHQRVDLSDNGNASMFNFQHAPP